jgi:alpha-L-rhamnosidase
VTVPPNTWSSVTLRNTTPDRVRESGRALAGDPGVRAVRRQGADVVVDVGSGGYRFTLAGR